VFLLLLVVVLVVAVPLAANQIAALVATIGSST
jgi:hypothetical protein